MDHEGRKEGALDDGGTKRGWLASSFAASLLSEDATTKVGPPGPPAAMWLSSWYHHQVVNRIPFKFGFAFHFSFVLAQTACYFL